MHLFGATVSVCLAHLASPCLALPSQQEGEPRVVRLLLQRQNIETHAAYDGQRLAKRNGTIQKDLDNLETLYFFNASLGTPRQYVRLHLDTGSSDLWVNAPVSTLCKSRKDLCTESGTYQANSSSTYEFMNSQFNISYVDGSRAAGDYAKDTLRFEEIELSRFQFGVGYTSTASQGILGIGYPENEMQAARLGKLPYENLPARLRAGGHIAAQAYSIWLEDRSSRTGTLLFGGIDRSRYHGTLVRVPVQKVGNTFREFFITMTGLSVGSKAVADDMALAVLLDTGSSLTYLPNDLVLSIYNELNATWIAASQAALVSCDLRQSKENITFKFSDPLSISVTMSELVLPIDATKAPVLPDGSFACLFGISPSGYGAVVLGDTFLRSAYVVYDMENNEISMAQSNFEAKPGGSDILEIGSGKKAVPDATAAPSPVAAQSGLPFVNSAAGAARVNLTYLEALTITTIAYVAIGSFSKP